MIDINVRLNMSVVSDFYKKLWPVDVGVPLIRLGGTGDGAYLVPDCMSGIELCLSGAES